MLKPVFACIHDMTAAVRGCAKSGLRSLSAPKCSAKSGTVAEVGVLFRYPLGSVQRSNFSLAPKSHPSTSGPWDFILEEKI